MEKGGVSIRVGPNSPGESYCSVLGLSPLQHRTGPGVGSNGTGAVASLLQGKVMHHEP